MQSHDVIYTGDEIDCHALSFHDSTPDLPSAGHDLSLAKAYIKELEGMFPEMTLLDANTVMPCTETARQVIVGAPIWKA